MKTAYMKSIDDVVIKDITLRELGDDEIRLGVDVCGVCGSDVTSALDGTEEYIPFGHEVAGTILEKGKAVKNLSIGQKVVLESSSACGRCKNCRDTKQELCTDIKSPLSLPFFGMAEEMISPAISAIAYEGITAPEACLSEPLGVAIDMFRLADVEVGSHVLVSGLGPIGLMALCLARISGAEKIYACDLSSAGIRLETAKRFGADEIIEIDKTPLEKYDFKEKPDRFLVSSPPKTLPLMMKIAAKGAVISYIGIKYGEGAKVTFDANEFHFKKLQMRGSFAYPALFTPMALDLIRSKTIDAKSLITHTFPLCDVREALKEAAYDIAHAIKVIVSVS